MQTYLCNWIEGDMTYAVQFDAVDWHQAERIAKQKGWVLLGQYVEEHDCPADVEAMIERESTNAAIH